MSERRLRAAWVWASLLLSLGLPACTQTPAALATLLAIEFGFSAVVVTALLLYAGAAWLVPGSPMRNVNSGCRSSSS